GRRYSGGPTLPDGPSAMRLSPGQTESLRSNRFALLAPMLTTSHPASGTHLARPGHADRRRLEPLVVSYHVANSCLSAESGITNAHIRCSATNSIMADGADAYAATIARRSGGGTSATSATDRAGAGIIVLPKSGQRRHPGWHAHASDERMYCPIARIAFN